MGIVIYKHLSDPNWLLAVFTLILVIVAILTLRAQTKSFKLTIGADLAMKLDERFSEPAFLADRVHAAEALKSQLNLKEAENVFDFLDMVGLFVRLKALDPEIAHSLFFHWINLYWTTGKEYIVAKQRTATLKWSDFKRLYEVTRQIEEDRDKHSEDLDLTPERIAEYLDDEIALMAAPTYTQAANSKRLSMN